MKKSLILSLIISLISSSVIASECGYSYRMQKQMLKNKKNVQYKVIDAQIQGKLLAIQELAGSMPCTNEARKERIHLYQSDIENLTNQKLIIKNNYKCALKNLRNCH